jgi:hypothetical protein
MTSAPAFDPMDIDSGNAEPQSPRVPYIVPPVEQTKVVKQRKPIRFGLKL